MVDELPSAFVQRKETSNGEVEIAREAESEIVGRGGFRAVVDD